MFEIIEDANIQNPRNCPDVRKLPNISDMVAHHARLRPNQIGAADSRRQLSYSEWSHRASGLASALLGQGLQPGERVAVKGVSGLKAMLTGVGSE